MQLTDADIEEFRDMCGKQLQLDLNWEESQQAATSLITLVNLVCGDNLGDLIAESNQVVLSNDNEDIEKEPTVFSEPV